MNRRDKTRVLHEFAFHLQRVLVLKSGAARAEYGVELVRKVSRQRTEALFRLRFANNIRPPSHLFDGRPLFRLYGKKKTSAVQSGHSVTKKKRERTFPGLAKVQARRNPAESLQRDVASQR
jgi:hypothetical protein